MRLNSNLIHQTIETGLSFLYPAQCRVCESVLGLESVPYVCNSCWSKIDVIQQPWCEICGSPNSGELCDDCAANPPQYGKLRAIANYDNTLQTVIHLFKFEKRKTLAVSLAKLVLNHFPIDIHIAEYDYILPIPIHKKRLQERGFNQAILIANQISKEYGINVSTDTLIKQKNTSPQSSLNRQERQTNIIGAFELQQNAVVTGKRILVLDDVYTTGATVREAVKVLWYADPAEVDVITLARTIYPE